MAASDPALAQEAIPAGPEAPPDLRAQGFINSRAVYANRSPAALTEIAITRGEGQLGVRGALAVLTGKRTGRSPQDRYLVAEPPIPAIQRESPIRVKSRKNCTFLTRSPSFDGIKHRRR